MNDNFLLYILLVFIIFGQPDAFTQTPTNWYPSDQTPWPSAMAGGFLAPQFSMFDMDQDGREELISFDRFSGIIQVWALDEIEGSYRLMDDVRIDWPVVQSWILIREFNQDKIPDIFTQR